MVKKLGSKGIAETKDEGSKSGGGRRIESGREDESRLRRGWRRRLELVRAYLPLPARKAVIVYCDARSRGLSWCCWWASAGARKALGTAAEALVSEKSRHLHFFLSTLWFQC